MSPFVECIYKTNLVFEQFSKVKSFKIHNEDKKAGEL